MRGSHRQRRLFSWLSTLVLFAMVMWPVGQPMPKVPGTQAYEQGSIASFNLVSIFGLLTEDDLEAEYHDYTVVTDLVREAPQGTPGLLISFLWTERLHRPPIA